MKTGGRTWRRSRGEKEKEEGRGKEIRLRWVVGNPLPLPLRAQQDEHTCHQVVAVSLSSAPMQHLT